MKRKSSKRKVSQQEKNQRIDQPGCFIFESAASRSISIQSDENMFLSTIAPSASNFAISSSAMLTIFRIHKENMFTAMGFFKSEIHDDLT